MLYCHRNITCVYCFGDTFASWQDFKAVIISKYDLDEETLQNIKKSVIFCKFPRYVKGRNILFVDGGLVRLERLGVKLLFNNIFTFKCSYLEQIHNINYKDVMLLQDDRVYQDHNPEDTAISVNYKKKINFDILEDVPTSKADTALIYATQNCRGLTNLQLSNIIRDYKFGKYLLLTDNPDYYDIVDCVDILEPPIERLFEKFSTYIYTPLQGRFDGSPRFPAECEYYGRDVIYHKDINSLYLEHDTGLHYRRYDIENNFSSLYLTEDDEIFNILEVRV